jgi:hypothetical protein
MSLPQTLFNLERTQTSFLKVLKFKYSGYQELQFTTIQFSNQFLYIMAVV